MKYTDTKLDTLRRAGAIVDCLGNLFEWVLRDCYDGCLQRHEVVYFYDLVSWYLTLSPRLTKHQLIYGSWLHVSAASLLQMHEKPHSLWPTFIPLWDTAFHTDHGVHMHARSTLTAQMMQDNSLTQAVNSPAWLKPQTPQPCLSLASIFTAPLYASLLLSREPHIPGAARSLPTGWHRLSVRNRQLREMNFPSALKAAEGRSPAACYNHVVWNRVLLAVREQASANIILGK